MPNMLIRTMTAVIFAVFFTTIVHADTLPGTTGKAAGSGWQSSWLNLNPALSFSKGEVLRITVTGTAENVIVRLLPSSSSPGTSDGVEGGVRKVPSDGVIEVTLERNHPRIKQISVHAGKEAWGTPLGANNGNVNVVAVDRAK